MIAKKLYVSEYGTWGTEHVELFDTQHWTEKDFDRLDAIGDFAKLQLAREITKKRKKQAKKAAYKAMFDAQFPEVRTFIYGSDGVEEVK